MTLRKQLLGRSLLGTVALLATLSGSGAALASLPHTASRQGGRQARLEPLQSVTANNCKSSNAKVLVGALQPHGFSLSTL